MGFGGHMGWGMGMGWLGGLFWLVILGLIVWLVVNAIQRGQSHNTPNLPPREDSLEILKRRFARGEIDAEEYEERRRLLEK